MVLKKINLKKLITYFNSFSRVWQKSFKICNELFVMTFLEVNNKTDLRT